MEGLYDRSVEKATVLSRAMGGGGGAKGAAKEGGRTRDSPIGLGAATAVGVGTDSANLDEDVPYDDEPDGTENEGTLSWLKASTRTRYTQHAMSMREPQTETQMMTMSSASAEPSSSLLGGAGTE